MKKHLHTISVIFLVTLVLGVVTVTGAAAWEHGSAEEYRLAADNPVPNAQFGRSVAIAGDLVAVGEGGDGTVGAVYLFRRQGMKYVPEATLVSPDAIPGTLPEFGRTVAIQGNTIFAGARFAQAGDQERAGAVYVFRKNRNSWQFEDKIVSPVPENEDNFGRALAVEGNLLVVTARKSNLEEGTAYVFTKKGDRWIYSQNLTASDATAGAYFGQSVDIQGNLIAIGARNADPKGAGAGYLFRKSHNSWTEIAKVTPLDGKKNDQYGFSLALSGDTLVVGSRRADPDGLTDAGAVYVYSLKRESAELVTRLSPKDASAGDEFGQSVAIAGEIIAVGAWKDDIGDNASQGSVYLFRQAGGRWTEAGNLTASDGEAGDEFGYSLAACRDRLVTGAHFADAKAGMAYVLPIKPLR